MLLKHQTFLTLSTYGRQSKWKQRNYRHKISNRRNRRFSSQYFQQTEPYLGNVFLEDGYFRDYLMRVLPGDVYDSVKDELTAFGARVAPGGDILKWGRDSENNPPKLINFNSWGRRVDEIQVDQGWVNLQRASAEEGLIATGYERKYGEYSRIIQFAKLYMFSASCGVFDCPLAMTDGAARVLELYNETIKSGPIRKELDEAFKHLTSRNPDEFWTSGQWMTEKTGGSDVRASETVALPQSDGSYNLSGFKFFTSATTSQMALGLGKIKEEGKVNRDDPISLFYIPMRKKDGSLNNIIIHRLKDKLGTKAVPTAELELIDSRAHLIGAPGKGVKLISSMLAITRLYTALASVSAMGRVLAVCKDYASKY